MDSARNLIVTRVAELGLSLSELSLRVGKNHAYFQQFIKRGVPTRLPEEVRGRVAEPDDFELDEDETSVIRADARPTRQHRPVAYHPPAEERTRTIIDHGRLTAARGRFSRGRKMTIVTAVAAVVTAAAVTILLRPHAQWPASVAIVKSEIAVACQNPNVVSEPNQVNFACSDTTKQILWVFALMTSGDNPSFAAAKTGRQGLEPIAPAQGGAIAWSLNLHHPYNPDNPIDSLEVAARAINNIIGGATLTRASAPEQTVRRAPDAGRYVLTDAVARGPAMFDTARLDRAGVLPGSDPDTELGRRAAAAGLQTAGLDEVLCIPAT